MLFRKEILALFQNVSRTYKEVSHQGLSRFSPGSSGLLLWLAVLSEFLFMSIKNARKIPGNAFTKRHARTFRTLQRDPVEPE